MKTNKSYILVLLSLVFIIALTSVGFSQVEKDKFVVVLDAGHGGKDHGNLGNGYKEKHIALKVILELGKTLEKEGGFKIIYTRKKDEFIPLWKRADIANKADADLFVSIHCNSVANPKPFGTETWVLGEKNTDRNFEFAKRENEVIFLEEDYEKNYAGFDPSSPESTIAIGIEQEVYVEQSILLGRKIEDAFKQKVNRKSRGLKQKSLLVIRNTYMPSVLVELGFLTNKKEGAFLNTKAGQSKMATAIKDAIIDYKNELSENIGEDVFNEDTNTTKITTTNPVVSVNSAKDVVFKVQIAASSNKIETKAYNFKGLSDITRSKEGNLYKYFHGITDDYKKAEIMKETAITKGYTSCFIVAYEDGKRISIETALKRP